MKLRDLYPSRYATGEDLAGKEVSLTIAGVSIEAMRPGPGQPEKQKPVLYFKEAKKGVVMSRTLARQIAKVLGSDDTDQWTGKKITLTGELMTVAGEPRIAIRMKMPDPGPAGSTGEPSGEGKKKE